MLLAAISLLRRRDETKPQMNRIAFQESPSLSLRLYDPLGRETYQVLGLYPPLVLNRSLFAEIVLDFLHSLHLIHMERAARITVPTANAGVRLLFQCLIMGTGQRIAANAKS